MTIKSCDFLRKVMAQNLQRCDMIEWISKKYEGNIRLNPPLQAKELEAVKQTFPTPLQEILKQTNGIKESMINPNTGEQIEISWIVYPYHMILEESAFYKDTYSLEGVVFSDDGAGNPYYLKTDGKIYLFEAMDNAEALIAASMEEFYQ